MGLDRLVEMFDIVAMQNTLRQFIETTDPTRTHVEWAQMLGISRQHFTEIVNGTARPGRRVIERINTATGGMVPPAAWFSTSDVTP
jgi:hypothetical protein